MIVTNSLAKVVVSIAAWITPGTVGVTLWPFIFIHPKVQALNTRIVRHEEKHLEQYKRYWIVGFLPLYIYQFIRYGYKDMALEVEARAAERK